MTESGSDDEEIEEEINKEMMDEIERKQQHPERLHPDLWFNEQGEVRAYSARRCEQLQQMYFMSAFGSIQPDHGKITHKFIKRPDLSL